MTCKPRVLLDVDGVLADFLTPAVVILRRLTGKPYRPEDFHTWDLFETVGSEWEKPFFRECNRPGFAASLDPYPGAREGVLALRAVSELYIVTSPAHHSATWTYERERWLEKHFDIPPNRVVHTSAKYLCRGDLFIDDRPLNVEKWAAEHPTGKAILWDAPYNRSATHLSRVTDWLDVTKIAQETV